MDKILCVDDDAGVLAVYKTLGRVSSLSKFQIDTAETGAAGLSAIKNTGPYAVIIADMQMPEMNGIEFLSKARVVAPETVRIMVTGHADLKVAVEAVNEGNVFRFLTKPTRPDTLTPAIEAAAEQYHLVRAEKELLERTLTGTVKAFGEVLSLVNPTAFGRASRAQRLAQQIGRELAIEQPWQLDVAAILSQLGCVTVSDVILRKETYGARLTPEEAAILDAYPRVSHDLIEQIPRLENVAKAVRHQRQRLDQLGGGLKAGDIPLEARILKVALDFDCLETRDLSRAEALQCLQERVGWYDEEIVKALGRALANEVKWDSKEVRLWELFAVSERERSRKLIRGTPLGETEQVMVLAEDVFAEDNALLLTKGQELTSTLIERLRHYAQHVRIRQPIRVLTPPKPQAGRN